MPESTSSDTTSNSAHAAPHISSENRGVPLTPGAPVSFRPRRAAFWLFAVVFFFNMLTSSREKAWGDAHGMWDVAVNLLAKQSLAIDLRWPEDIPPGRDGKYYCISPFGPSLVHVPGAFVASVAKRYAPVQYGLLLPLCVHLAPAALGAGACALLFLLCITLGTRPRSATLAALMCAAATSTWVYSRYPYSEAVQLFGFTWLALATMRAHATLHGGVAYAGSAPEAPGSARDLGMDSRLLLRAGLHWGASASFLLNAKYVLAVAIAGAALSLAWASRKHPARLARFAVGAALTGGFGVAVALWYNWARWGSVTASGYEAYLGAFFGGSFFDGAWGMLFSPNKSIFLYAPPLVLAVFGLPWLVRQRPEFGQFLAVALLPVFGIYCTYRSWSGDYAWGPRFIVWAVPVMCVGIAGAYEGFLAEWQRRWRRALIASVIASGCSVSALGAGLYWDHFIRISQQAKEQWLGKPNRAGAYVAEAGRGHCDSCFEDTYQILWTPAFSPIKGHAWLLTALWNKDSAEQALQYAPWRRYSVLPLNIASSFARARFDWWGQLWRVDFPHTANLGVLVLVMFAGGLVTAAVMLRRSVALPRAPAP